MGRVQFKALLLDLREQDARVLNHGVPVPVPASPAIADRIVTRLNKISAPFNTRLVFNPVTYALIIEEA